MDTYQTLIMDVSQEGVAAIVLNRPSVANALTSDLVAELADAFATLARTPEVRLVILRGSGEVFSAGSDPDWLRASGDYSREEHEEDAFALAETLRALRELPQPTIALVHGAATDIGAGLALACDTLIAGPAATFSFSEVRHGGASIVLAPYLIEAVGPRWARSLMTLGETADLDLACRIGIVHYRAASETDMEAILERLADAVFRASPAAIAEVKDGLDALDGQVPSADLSRWAARRLAHNRVSEHGREGLAARIEKRSPQWRI